MQYEQFLNSKRQANIDSGFDPIWMPEFLFDFQRHLVTWAIRKGRAAIFADCGLGKTPMQLVWAENVLRKTNRSVLIVTPLAVSYQTVWEAEKFGIGVRHARHANVNGTPSIWVTNYEQLEKLESGAFAGVVCDESSAIKSFESQRRSVVTEFMRQLPYRLLCTATPSPNDYHELGTSSEALGYLGFRDMITTFFRQETQRNHLGWGRTKYRFRGHAEQPFWQWVCSWAMSCRKPSDLGFDDGDFVLPPLYENEINVECDKAMPGYLFQVPARTMDEHRSERRMTLEDRCQVAANRVENSYGPSLAWCHLNTEADLMERIIPGAVQVSGSMADELKEERLLAFAKGELETLVTKPKIGCWGLNFQHCAHQVMFPSDSFEQYYQAVRRSWRFGQTRPVTIDIVTTEGGRGVLNNLKKKSARADAMFESLNRFVNDSREVECQYGSTKERVPSWV